MEVTDWHTDTLAATDHHAITAVFRLVKNLSDVDIRHMPVTIT